MSITDIQRAFVRGLEGKAACRTAMSDLEDGGKMQRLSFHVVSGSHGAAYLSETIPADMCPMQHARTMAANYLEGRITGQSRFVSPGAPLMQATAAPLAPSPPVAVVSAPAAPPTPPVTTPAAPAAPAPQPPADLTNEIALLDAMSRRGDIAGGIDLVCRWIDDEAEICRGAMTPGQTLEYEQIRREINDVAHGLCPATPGECPNLWASVGVDVQRTGDDAADIRAAAEVINRRIDQTNEFLARVRQVRIASKQAAKAAGSIEGALAVYHAIEWPAA